jgi:tetratricopeptide (TPR) repeat protein
MTFALRIEDQKMIRPAPPHRQQTCTRWIRFVLSGAFATLMAACTVPLQKIAPAPIPGPDANITQQRIERARANLNDGLKKYDSGSNEDAIRSFLMALDSGQLPLADQLNARKHIAFIHCVSGREANCKEEFEKLISLDPKFELSPAEAGHPAWGPVFRVVRTEIELRRTGQPVAAPAAKSVPSGEKLIAEAMVFYYDADYDRAIKIFQNALKEPLSSTDQINAHKFIAFSYCLTNRQAQCRAEFEPIFALNANFDLAPAEAGHPSWGPPFRAVKAKQKSATPKKQ